MENIKEFLKSLPTSSGVYQMIDKEGNIIYIGKAKNLKNRIPSYFKENLNRNKQIEKMVTLIDNIEITVTNNEVEALILENNLIKEHQPKYNTLLRDDKTYPYIEITLEDEYPRIILSRNKTNKNSKYFGPFPDVNAAKEVIELLRKLYKIRSCDSLNLPKKECLYYQIKKCNAPCIGKQTKEEYLKQLDSSIKFLNGDYSNVKKELQNKMNEYSQDLNFEKAAETRDLIKSIDIMFKKQIIDKSKNDKDVLSIKTKNEETIIVTFLVRNGKVIDKKSYSFKQKENNEKSFLLSKFIEQYYTNNINIPKTIIVNSEIEEKQLLEAYLKEISGYKISITKPIKGDNLKLIELADRNAELILNENERKLKLKEQVEQKAIKELETLLGLNNLNRLESYDISHLSGVYTVGSMIVYENNRLNKKAYRKFKLEDKNDDFNSLKDMLERRFKDEKLKEIIPSLLLIDGGMEQVSKIEELLKEISLEIPVIGMVKNDKHQTHHLLYNKKEIEFGKNNNAYKLICNIQDETHNFAINYNKTLREKDTTKSILDNIEGVGDTRKKILLKEFKDIETIKTKNIEDLSKIKGIDKKTAENIYNYFH